MLRSKNPRSFSKLRRLLLDQRGASIIVVLGLVFVISLLSISLAKSIVTFMRTTYQVEQANAAYFSAEGGVEMALYDLLAYKDGYETTKVAVAAQAVCNNVINTSATGSFDQECKDENPYRFVNFSDAINLSGARGFWRIFARTIADKGGADYPIPNPYFIGNKDGELETDEWGRLNRARSLSLSLLTDNNPYNASGLLETDPSKRYNLRVQSGIGKKLIFMVDPKEVNNWDSSFNSTSDKEEILTWTLSALDTSGDEYALQGVVWESDFELRDCDGNGTTDRCFVLDFLPTNSAITIDNSDGHVLAGEDINLNLTHDSQGIKPNRVSGVSEDFRFATPRSFIEDLNRTGELGKTNGKDLWQSARLTVNLIASLSNTSGVASNSLRYKLVSNEQWADEFTYIVSQGFAGKVKQTIETSFRRSTTLPVFTYAIFQ